MLYAPPVKSKSKSDGYIGVKVRVKGTFIGVKRTRVSHYKKLVYKSPTPILVA